MFTHHYTTYILINIYFYYFLEWKGKEPLI
jgi:hypothetical protein